MFKFEPHISKKDFKGTKAVSVSFWGLEVCLDLTFWNYLLERQTIQYLSIHSLCFLTAFYFGAIKAWVGSSPHV